MCRCAHASRALQVSATRRRRVSCAFEVETISVKMWSMSSGGRRKRGAGWIATRPEMRVSILSLAMVQPGSDNDDGRETYLEGLTSYEGRAGRR